MGKMFGGFICILPFIVWLIVVIIVSYSFSVGCEQYLKRAADANTVEMAKTQLTTALTYMEQHNLTSGICSIFLQQPKNDVGFWYNNIKAAKAELDSLPINVTPLERTNVLMKLRETLVDQGESTSITLPSGISQYPNNKTFFWLGIIFALLGCIGCIVFYAGLSDY